MRHAYVKVLTAWETKEVLRMCLISLCTLADSGHASASKDEHMCESRRPEIFGLSEAVARQAEMLTFDHVSLVTTLGRHL